MTIAYRLALFIVLFALAPSLQAQVRSADTMVQKIFATLKAKDQKAFVALYPNAQQFSRFIRNIMEQTLKSDEMKQLMAMDEKSKGMNLDSLVDAQVAAVSSAEGFQKMESEFGKAFQKIIEKGESKGVKWNEAILTGFTIDSTQALAEGSPIQPKGLKEAKGVIDFSVGDSAYQLAYSKMMFIESEGGWFGADFPQLARKGESLAPDATPGEDDEDTGIMTEEGTKPEAKKATKAPAKKPAAKAKPKTQAPVKKKTKA